MILISHKIATSAPFPRVQAGKIRCVTKEGENWVRCWGESLRAVLTGKGSSFPSSLRPEAGVEALVSCSCWGKERASITNLADSAGARKLRCTSKGKGSSWFNLCRTDPGERGAGREGSVVHPLGAVAAATSRAKRGGSARRREVIFLNGTLAVGREAKNPLFF